MKRETFIIGICLLFFTTSLWGQRTAGNCRNKKAAKDEYERPVNFGVKGGFTSSLFLTSNFVLNGVEIEEMQNNYKIGYFASLFMRINFGRHFLQPEVSYTINRCNITFEKPLPEDAPENSVPEMASVTSSIHSFEVPVIYGYNIIKEGPYSLAIFGGPKMRYIWDKKSTLTFENFDQQHIREELYPLNVSFTTGVAVTISRVFFDFRYDIGLHNISKRISYQPILENNAADVEIPANQIRFHRRDNVLSFSLGVFF